MSIVSTGRFQMIESSALWASVVPPGSVSDSVDEAPYSAVFWTPVSGCSPVRTSTYCVAPFSKLKLPET